MFGKSAKQAELLDNLPLIFTRVQKQTQLPPGDFPDIAQYKSILLEMDFDKLPKMYTKLLDKLDQAITEDLPLLMKEFPSGPNIPPPPVFNPYTNSHVNPVFSHTSQNNSSTDKEGFHTDKNFPQHEKDLNKTDGTDGGTALEKEINLEEEPVSVWGITKADENQFSKMFHNLQPVQGKISGNQAKMIFSEANLPNSELAEMWQLADADNDGCLTHSEFMVMMKLVQIRLQGGAIPSSLPTSLKKILS